VNGFLEIQGINELFASRQDRSTGTLPTMAVFDDDDDDDEVRMIKVMNEQI